MTNDEPVIFTRETQAAYDRAKRFMANVDNGDDAANDDLVEQIIEDNRNQ